MIHERLKHRNEVSLRNVVNIIKMADSILNIYLLNNSIRYNHSIKKRADA